MLFPVKSLRSDLLRTILGDTIGDRENGQKSSLRIDIQSTDSIIQDYIATKEEGGRIFSSTALDAFSSAISATFASNALMLNFSLLAPLFGLVGALTAKSILDGITEKSNQKLSEGWIQ